MRLTLIKETLSHQNYIIELANVGEKVTLSGLFSAQMRLFDVRACSLFETK